MSNVPPDRLRTFFVLVRVRRHAAPVVFVTVRSLMDASAPIVIVVPSGTSMKTKFPVSPSLGSPLSHVQLPGLIHSLSPASPVQVSVG